MRKGILRPEKMKLMGMKRVELPRGLGSRLLRKGRGDRLLPEGNGRKVVVLAEGRGRLDGDVM